MMATQRIPQNSRLSLLMCTLFAFGCAGGCSKLFEDHMATDRKARAQQQWESMRASVKMQLAENHLNAGRLDDASKVIDEAIKMAPDNVKARILATRIEIERGELSKARESIHTAMSFAYADPQVRYLAGMVAERYDDLEGALDHYTAASEAAPLVAEYLLARIETLAALARDIDAIELLELRMTDFDANASMRALAAYECRRLGLRGPAIDYSREALRLRPRDRSMKAELAATLVWAQEYDEATVLFESLLKDAPDATKPGDVSDSNLRVQLAAAHLGKGSPKAAIDCLQSLIKDEPANATALSLYARAAFESGDNHTAKRTIRALHDRCRVTPESLMLLVLIQQKEGDGAAALTTARQLIKVEGETASGYCVLGRTLESLGNVVEAREAYSAALRIDPTFAPARALLAELAPAQAAVSGQPAPSNHEITKSHRQERVAAREPPGIPADKELVGPRVDSSDAVTNWLDSLGTHLAAGTPEEEP